MTDTELDALVKRLENVSLQVGFPSRTILDSAVIRQAIDTITTLRAQLAEAMAGLHGPINQLSASDYSNIIAHLSLELEPTGPLPSRNTVMMALVKESNASRQQAERAIHAEAERDAAQAALAAQIEAAAGIAEAQEALAAKRANDDDADARSDWDAGMIFGTQVGARLISASIRAQPHDSTALDRMLRAEREKALREVLNAMPKPPEIATEHSHEHGEACAIHCVRQIILAMVEQPEIGSGGKP